MPVPYRLGDHSEVEEKEEPVSSRGASLGQESLEGFSVGLRAQRASVSLLADVSFSRTACSGLGRGNGHWNRLAQ